MEYVNLYNDSLFEFINIISKKYNLDSKKVKDEYKYVHTKKMTGYMLFVKDMYKQNNIDNDVKFTNNSKIISQKWKALDKDSKKVYNDKAKEMNNSYKKDAATVEKPKKQQIKSTKIKVEYNNKLDDTTLTEVEYDGNKYVVDNFGNIIDITNDIGTYIGYIKDQDVYMY